MEYARFIQMQIDLPYHALCRIDEKGKVVSHEIKKTVINSKARLVYEDVSDILENDNERAKNKNAAIFQIS